MNDDILPTELMHALSGYMISFIDSGRLPTSNDHYIAGAADAIAFLVGNIATPNFQKVLAAVRASK